MSEHPEGEAELRLSSVEPPEGLSSEQRVYFAEHEDGEGYFTPWKRTPILSLGATLRWRLTPNPFAEQKAKSPDPPRLRDALVRFHALPVGARVMWLGHGSVLLEMDGRRILVDPLFGRIGGLMGRLVQAPVHPDALPPIDLVLLTHGHRDHCDTPSLHRLVERFGRELRFLVPRGLRGVVPEGAGEVTELDWWQRASLGGLSMTFTPAQHWHRRGLLDINDALWGSWVIQGSRSVFISGDTAWFEGFGTIGDVLGPLDLAILPLGSYEPRWLMGRQHIAPEDALAAFERLGARSFLGYHFATYDLSDDPPDHGVHLLARLLEERGLDRSRFFVLAHGGSLALGDDGAQASGTWEEGLALRSE